ncbi:bis(5'-nucleosyl)-tetraphosphatase (symmetrical) YqeK [Candidatus Sumerlaeota bacterium]|nr:bis(5'-nucleosyl)-tetraphosphatase (symmetrical) YqeK [Candidatus Sumerlaeota bacterium]
MENVCQIGTNAAAFDKWDQMLRERLTQQRYWHCIGTMQTAVAIAEGNGLNTTSAAAAGLLHDCERCAPTDVLLRKIQANGVELPEDEAELPYVYHTYCGAWTAEHEFGLHDPDALAAIRTHSTGGANLSPLQQSVFIADLVEPTRPYAQEETIQEIRRTACRDLRLATPMALRYKARLSEIKSGGALNPRTREMVEAYL